MIDFTFDIQRFALADGTVINTGQSYYTGSDKPKVTFQANGNTYSMTLTNDTKFTVNSVSSDGTVTLTVNRGTVTELSNANTVLMKEKATFVSNYEKTYWGIVYIGGL